MNERLRKHAQQADSYHRSGNWKSPVRGRNPTLFALYAAWGRIIDLDGHDQICRTRCSTASLGFTRWVGTFGEWNQKPRNALVLRGFNWLGGRAALLIRGSPWRAKSAHQDGDSPRKKRGQHSTSSARFVSQILHQPSETSIATAIAESPAAQPVNKPRPPPLAASSSISSMMARKPIGACG